MQDLGTLGGDYSSAEAINEDGQVVGTARLANSTPHAFLWDGAMQDLGALTWDQSIAYDINDKGQVVGVLQTGQNSHAFLWANGQMQDLNNLIPANSGWVLSEARAINNKGQIVGFGTINGQTRAFLLKPQRLSLDQPERRRVAPDHELGSARRPRRRRYRHLCPERAIYGGCQHAVAASAPAVNFPVGRMIISGTNTVDFHNLDLNLLDDSPDEPA